MENTSQSVLEEHIQDLAKTKPKGITNTEITSLLPGVPLEAWMKAINKLLKAGTLQLFKDKGQLLYKYGDVQSKTTAKGSDSEEKLVYKIIEESGNIGIWVRDIRFKSNLNMTQLNKILKSLETKKIIKAVKSVSASKKKVYMLFDLEPDSSVTGGAWYQDQDFESEFVDVLNQQCERFLLERRDNAIKQGGGPLLVRNRSYATASDVHKFITELGISKVRLSVEDMESILYTVVLDNKAERIVNKDGIKLYRAINKFLDATGIVKSTCGVCPIAPKCGDVGLVTPKACEYFTNWLNE